MRQRRAAATGVGIAALGALGLFAALGGCAGDDDGELSVDAFCEQVVVVQRLDAQLGQIETLELESTFAELEELTSRAPDDIQPSLEVLTGYIGDVVADMAEVEPGDTEAADEVLGDQSMSADELTSVEEAGRAVETYTQEQCAFDLRSGATLAPTTSAPTTTTPPTTGES
jgi:hypothetical protein